MPLWRQFEACNPDRPFLNWATGFARIETRRFLSRESRRAQLTEKATEALEHEMRGSGEFDNAIETHLATCLGNLAATHPERVNAMSALLDQWVLVRVRRIELRSQAWEARVLPLNDTRPDCPGEEASRNYAPERATVARAFWKRGGRGKSGKAAAVTA